MKDIKSTNDKARATKTTKTATLHKATQFEADNFIFARAVQDGQVR